MRTGRKLFVRRRAPKFPRSRVKVSVRRPRPPFPRSPIVIISTRFLALTLAAGLACSQPAIEVVGGKGGPSGGDGGGSGNGTGGKSGGNGTGGAFNVSFGDGGVADASAPNPLGEGNACVTEAHQAMRVPVDLLLLLDISGSMEESAGGTQSKWTAM